MQTRRGSRTVCLGFESREHYDACVGDAALFRGHLESQHVTRQAPGAVPCGHGRRILAAQQSPLGEAQRRDTPHPTQRVGLHVSSPPVVPHAIHGRVHRRRGEGPISATQRRFARSLEYAFGRNHMFWYRASAAVGRFSVVGTTVKSPADMPGHLVADEKHTWLRGEKAYVATTAGAGCVVGAEVSTSASATALTQSYGVFANEARDVDPEYTPKTVCLDRWQPTRKAWEKLFPTVAVILCFLHSVLKLVRSRPTGVVREKLIGRAWHVYAAPTKARSFAEAASTARVGRCKSSRGYPPRCCMGHVGKARLVQAGVRL
jgi:hypothetical protein